MRSAALLLTPLGVVLSGSRGAVLLLLVGLAACWLLPLLGRPRRWPSWRAAGLLVSALLLAIVLVQALPRGRESYLARLAGVTGTGADGGAALRLERWQRFIGRGSPAGGATAAASSQIASYLTNGDLENGGDQPAGFRTLPGTRSQRAAEAAYSGGFGIVFAGNPAEPARRAAVYQQHSFGGARGGTYTAAVWVRLPAPISGEVSLYTNVLYTDGSRSDPHSRVSVDTSQVGVWQRLTAPIVPDPARRIDFVGVYLLTDDLRGTVQADGFTLVEGATARDSAEVRETAALPPGALDAGARFRASPLLGAGPGKADEAGAIDNEYLLVLARYGVVGLAAYLALWLALLWSLVRRARLPGGGPALAFAGTVLGLLAFNLVAGSLFHLQLMGLLWPLAGALLAHRPLPPDEAA